MCRSLGIGQTRCDTKYAADCVSMAHSTVSTPCSLSSNDRLKAASVLSSLLESDHYESLISELKCVSCHEYMSPPIHICIKGHSICKNCFKTKYKCDVCGDEFSQIRCLVLDALAAKMQFPCKHEGCPRHATLAKLETHIGDCEYRIINCFMTRVYGDCTWKGRAGQWIDHCFTEHKKRVSELPFLTVRYEWNPKNVGPVLNYHLMKCYETVFNVYQIYDKKGGRMMWTVLWSDLEDANKFYYEVDIFVPDDPTKKIVYRKTCKSEKDADFLVYTQNVYVPIETIFAMLDKDSQIHYTVRIGEVESLKHQEVHLLQDDVERISLAAD